MMHSAEKKGNRKLYIYICDYFGRQDNCKQLFTLIHDVYVHFFPLLLSLILSFYIHISKKLCFKKCLIIIQGLFFFISSSNTLVR